MFSFDHFDYSALTDLNNIENIQFHLGSGLEVVLFVLQLLSFAMNLSASSGHTHQHEKTRECLTQ